jgi:hypothetical protein
VRLAGRMRRGRGVYPSVGPYREAAENVEAGLDALEVGAFKASLARRARRVRVGLLLTVLAATAWFGGLVIWHRCHRVTTARVASSGPRDSPRMSEGMKKWLSRPSVPVITEDDRCAMFPDSAACWWRPDEARNQ